MAFPTVAPASRVSRAARGLAACAVLPTALLGGCDATAPSDTAPVTISVCHPPTWMAYRDGAGAWRRLLPDARGTVTIEVAPRVEIAMWNQDGDFGNLLVVRARREELRSLGFGGAQCGAFVTVSGVLRGVPAGDMTFVSTAPFSTILASDSAFEIAMPQPASAFDVAAAAGFQAAWPLIRTSAVGFIRGAPASGGDVGAIDMLPLVDSATISAEGASVVGSEFGSARDAWLSLSRSAVEQGVGIVQGVSAAGRVAGDVHEVFALSFDGDAIRYAGVFTAAVGARTLQLGPLLAIPFARLNTSGRLPWMQLATQPEYASGVDAEFWQWQGRTVSIRITAGYGDPGGKWTLDFEDLLAAPGFDPEWGLLPGFTTRWSVTAWGGTALPYRAAPQNVDGAHLRSSTRSGGDPAFAHD